MSDNIFYVYEWYNKDTGEVFYGGEGYSRFDEYCEQIYKY